MSRKENAIRVIFTCLTPVFFGLAIWSEELGLLLSLTKELEQILQISFVGGGWLSFFLAFTAEDVARII